jgi:hypothetical protein
MRLSIALSVLSGITVYAANSTALTPVVRAKAPAIQDLSRGRRNKKKKKRRVPATARWNQLVNTMDGFLKKHLGARHKKIRSHLNRVRSMTDTNLPLPGALGRSGPRCVPVEESKPFLRRQKAEFRKDTMEARRTKRIDAQNARKAARNAKKLFNGDFVEEQSSDRRRRSDDDQDELLDEYYDYENYTEFIVAGEHMKDYDLDFVAAYPDYESFYGESDESLDAEDFDLNDVKMENHERLRRDARARRKKKKGSGKLGPKRIWFNMMTAARSFINTELKGCSEKNTFIKRVGRLATRVKKNAPILTAPVKKCRGRKCRKQRG